MFKLRYLPPLFATKRLISGLFLMSKLFVLKLTPIKQAHLRQAHEPEFKRPCRRYEVPQLEVYASNSRLECKYLRPTLYCNPFSGLIIAMANRLGAGESTDWDFCEKAFEFVKRNISIELLPLDEAEATLIRGTGTCLHKLNLMVALCRAAGIKARYKLYVLSSVENLELAFGDARKSRQWYQSLGKVLFHGEVELYLGGCWVTCSPGLSDERQASLNLPITRFGEQAIGVWYSVEPGSITRVESIFYGLNILMKSAKKLAPSFIDKANIKLAKQCKTGRKILDESGEHAYDAQARSLFLRKHPEIKLLKKDEIIFEK